MNEFHSLKKLFKNFEIARNTPPVEQVPDKTVPVHKWYNHKIWTTSRNRYKLHGEIEDVDAPVWGKTKTILPTFCPVMDMYTIKGITNFHQVLHNRVHDPWVERCTDVQEKFPNFEFAYYTRWLINLFQYILISIELRKIYRYLLIIDSPHTFYDLLTFLSRHVYNLYPN